MAYVTIDTETLKELTDIVRLHAHAHREQAKLTETSGDGSPSFNWAAYRHASAVASKGDAILDQEWRARNGHTWSKQSELGMESLNMKGPDLGLKR